MKGFSIGEVIKFGWKTFLDHWMFFVLIGIFALIISALPDALGYGGGYLHRPDSRFWVVSLSLLLKLVIDLLVEIGFIHIGIKMARGEQIRFADFFNRWSVIIYYFVAKLLLTLLLIAGTILLIFPAFIWGARYGFAVWLIVDKKMGPIEAFRRSAEITMGYKWDIFALWWVSMFILLAGVLALGIGLFVSYPVVLVAYGLVYHKILSGDHKALGVAQPAVTPTTTGSTIIAPPEAGQKVE